MTLTAYLIGDTLPVALDERTAELGGSFYLSPHIQPYSPLPLAWAYEQLIRYPKAVLLDIGASTGSYSLLAAHHPDLTVCAFEPVDLTFKVLNENVYLNRLGDKVSTYRLGVSNYEGWDVLHTIKQDGGKGVSMVGGYPAKHKDVIDSSISVTTVDHFCSQHNIIPTMIKIDTEGAEKLVLEGARVTIENYHPFILVEYAAENAAQYGYLASDIIRMLEDWGYFWKCPEGLDLWAVHRNWEQIK